MMSSHASPLGALQLFGFMTFAHSWMGVAFGAVFTALMAVAAAYDLRERRIPNAVVLATAAMGAVFTILTLGIRALVFRFLGGAATGLVIWLPFWWAGLMGAGDVKIFAAAAAWLGPAAALGAAVLTALAGGVLGLAWILVVHRLRTAAASPGADAARTKRSRMTVPYGVAMAVGLTMAAWVPRLVH
jgi:prepilin peptidase CpaA